MRYLSASIKGMAALAMVAAAGATPAGESMASGADAGKGQIAALEQRYLKFVIDHHYGALRMAELAAGTSVHRSAAILPAEGTAPTPNTVATPAKASLDEIKSIGRRDNRVQREEILAAQRMLMKWYRVSYAPTLSADAKEMIAMLERAPAGAQFDKEFLRHMSHHHYQVLTPSLQCVVSANLAHGELQRYCKGIVEAQTMEIDEMRHLLCQNYADCHYQPFPMNGNHGRHADTPDTGQ